MNRNTNGTISTMLGRTVLAMLACAGSAATASQTIEPRLLYPGAALPGGAPAVGDFDGDGDLDLLSSGTRLYLYMNGGGPLLEPVRVENGLGSSIATGDLDGDGDLDAVGLQSTGLMIGLNDGSGAFDRAISIVGERLRDLALGDLDGDGVLDIVVVDGGTNEVVSLLGRGDGSFHGPEVRYTLDTSPTAVLLADINGDGHADVLAGGWLDNSLTLLAGDGTGALTLAGAFDLGDGALDLAFVDMDADGHRDIVASTVTSLSLLRGLGGGAYADAERYGVPGVGVALAIGDVDGDGDPDAVRISTGSLDGGRASVLLNEGPGGFTILPAERVGTSAGAAALVDADGDGDLDLATRGTGMTVLLNDGTGRLQGGTTLATPGVVWDIAAADFNGDGLDDLAAGNRNEPSVVSLHASLPGGGFADPTLFPCGTDPLGIDVADFDDDGRQDVVTASFFASNATVLLNTGGAFGDPIVVPSGGFPYDVAAGDANGDGVPDVLTPSWAASTLTLSLGNGDGTFGPGRTIPTGRQTRGVALGDFNGDGAADLLAANGGEGRPSLVLGMAGGDFGQAQPVDIGWLFGQDALAVGDLDGDGFDDAAFVNDRSSAVGVVFGGPGGLASPMLLWIDGLPARPAIADVDGDGVQDLVVPESFDGSVYVFRGRRDRVFGEPLRFTAGRRATSVAVGDFNGDGLTDLAVPNEDDRSISVLFSRGAPCRADFDGDGELTLFDFLAFQNAFDAGEAIADFDGDGELTIFDFLAFQNAFDAGCD